MPVALAALFPLLAVLVGCTELPLQELPAIVLDGIPIYGRGDQVSKPELRAAIALDRSLMSGAAGKIYFNRRNESTKASRLPHAAQPTMGRIPSL